MIMIGSRKVITNKKIIVMIKIKIMMKTIGPDMERPQYTIPNPKHQIHQIPNTDGMVDLCTWCGAIADNSSKGVSPPLLHCQWSTTVTLRCQDRDDDDYDGHDVDECDSMAMMMSGNDHSHKAHAARG